ncbi:MAG: hypothetical protein DRO18_07880, partial [Thermoprotei archaeon]
MPHQVMNYIIKYKSYIFPLLGLVILLYILSLLGFNPLALIETGLLAMTPLALAAIGESINERAGIVNIGLEGIFLITALAGVYGAEVALEAAKSPIWRPLVTMLSPGVIGLLFGAFIGAVIGFVFGIMSVYARANQIVAGMGINIFALGLIQYLLM